MFTRFKLDEKQINKALDSFFNKFMEEIKGDPVLSLIDSFDEIPLGRYLALEKSGYKIDCHDFEFHEMIEPQSVIPFLDGEFTRQSICREYTNFIHGIAMNAITETVEKSALNGSNHPVTHNVDFYPEQIMRDRYCEALGEDRINQIKKKMGNEPFIIFAGMKQFAQVKKDLGKDSSFNLDDKSFIIPKDVYYDEIAFRSHCLAFRKSALHWAFSPFFINVTPSTKNPILYSVNILQSVGAFRRDGYGVLKIECAEKRNNGFPL